MSEPTGRRRRVLAIASQFKATQVEYLKSLAEHVDLTIAAHGDERAGFTQQTIAGGLPVTAIGRIGLQRVEARLRALVASSRAEIVHTLFHYNEEMTVLARRLVGEHALIVHECRDPLTTMLGRTVLSPGSDPLRLERDALVASDGQIFVSRAMRTYLERTHELELSDTSIIVPMCFCSRRRVAPPQRKLSEEDGRVHLVLDGTVSSLPDHGRYHVNIIRRLVGLGLVVHSHFHDCEGHANPVYRALSDQLDDYHYHETIAFDDDTRYSRTLSRYDLMGVFHELDAARHNESALLAMSMPTKAVSGWLVGGIPTVCFAHYQGVIETARALGIGFVADSWDDVSRIAADRAAIARASEACLACRDRFTTERCAEQVAGLLERLLARAPSGQG